MGRRSNSKSRFGVGVFDQIVNAQPWPTAPLRANYLGAVAAGADSFWVGDHLNSLFPRSIASRRYVGAARLVPKVDAILEPWTVLGHLAARNRIGRLRLGVSVTDAGRRNPAVTAQAAATLHLLTGGRAVLGIGTGEREGNEPYGVEWSKPVTRLEEALATIRALWNSGGELISRDSPYFPLHDAVFELPPHKGKWPEIWVASHGPRMLRITGRYADGWVPALIAPTEYAAGLDAVRSAASDAGRDPMSVKGAWQGFAVVGRTRDDVEEALSSDAIKSIALLAPADWWERHGVSHPMGLSGGATDIMPQLIDEQTALSYTRQVPQSLLREGLLTGTPNDIVEQAAEWRDQGVRHITLGNVSTLQPNFRKGLASTLPFLQAIRGLKRL
ncbi:MAG TPA: LLM class flavin-dependent oxidoreductase [Tepidiformaceae bacterium]|jgi:phthiodiolone/phenolphthiodiolone dimycocerosates ketoreductase|nr:LLM class flavin-dependent oxidoreductase [Tepidiformaceae bacterium]